MLNICGYAYVAICVASSLLLPLTVMACEAGDDIRTSPVPVPAATTAAPADNTPRPQNQPRPAGSTAGNGLENTGGATDEGGQGYRTVADIDTARKTVISDLTNAALAEENYFVDHQVYTTSVNDLAMNGFRQSPNVVMQIITGDNLMFCIEAYDHGNATDRWHFNSRVGSPVVGVCP